MDIVLRPLDRPDVPAWTRLLAAAEAVDRTGEHHTSVQLEEELGDPETEVVGAFAGKELIGYLTVQPRGESEGAFRVHVAGTVPPAHRGRGVGTMLVAEMVARATAAASERRPDLPARITTIGPSRNAEQAALLQAAGLEPEGSTLVMRARLDDLPHVPAFPDGFEPRCYVDAMAEPLRRAHNLAFAGAHPGFTPWSESRWRQGVTDSSTFRPALTRVAVPLGSEQIVGYVVTHEFLGQQEATGRREAYVAKVGTLADHRGRGLAGALLGHCLQAYAAAGYDEAALDVDAANPTGARVVYERVGFAVEATWTKYALSVG